MTPPLPYRVGYRIGSTLRRIMFWIRRQDHIAAERRWETHVAGALALVQPEPYDLWVARLRRQAELDALEGAIRRHSAGKRRPR